MLTATLALLGFFATSGRVPLSQPLVQQLAHSGLRYDASRDLLVSYQDSKDREVPAIIVATTTGETIAQVTPLKDFPQAASVDVWDAAASSSGVVVAAVIQDARPPRHVLLMYDKRGMLQQLWQTSPYFHPNVAVDRFGSVFGFGSRMDGVATEHLLVKYTPQGTVAATFLPAQHFSKGEEVVFASGQSGINRLWMSGDRLLLYVAGAQELFEFDLQGALLRTVPLAVQLKRFAEAEGGRRTMITQMTSGPSGAIVAQVGIWKEQKGFAFHLARLSWDPNGKAEPIQIEAGSELGTPSMQLLGSQGDQLLFLDATAGTLIKQ